MKKEYFVQSWPGPHSGHSIFFFSLVISSGNNRAVLPFLCPWSGKQMIFAWLPICILPCFGDLSHVTSSGNMTWKETNPHLQPPKWSKCHKPGPSVHPTHRAIEMDKGGTCLKMAYESQDWSRWFQEEKLSSFTFSMDQESMNLDLWKPQDGTWKWSKYRGRQNWATGKEYLDDFIWVPESTHAWSQTCSGFFNSASK